MSNGAISAFFTPAFYGYSNHNTTGSTNPGIVVGSIACVVAFVVAVIVIVICCLREDKQQSSRSTTSRLHPDPTARTLTMTSRPPQEQRHVALTVNPGINEATINGFPRLLYSDLKRLHETRGSTSALTCSICLKDYNTVDDLRLLPNCGHLFHRSCIDPWLLSRVTCPVCRASPLPRPASTL